LIGMRRESARACTSSMDVGAGGATLEGNVDIGISGTNPEDYLGWRQYKTTPPGAVRPSGKY
jgi:hypothetical protein